MKISFVKPATPDQGVIVAPVFEGKVFGPKTKELDAQTGGALSRAIARGKFDGKKDQTATVPAPAGIDAARVVLVGLGKPKAVDVLAAQAFGGQAVVAGQASGEQSLHVLADWVDGMKVGEAELAAHAAYGARLKGYRFDKYFTKEKKEDKPQLRKVSVEVAETMAAKALFATLDKVADGVELTRNLVSEPANIINPESFADEIRKLESLGLKIDILGEKQMKKLGFGALLGVGQGSAKESQLAVMRWDGAADPHQAPVAFVGKGVTFDSGGISIKPGAGMEDMKWDLARLLLAESEVMAIGLGARDSLRLEAGLCLYGHDIDETTTPIEADLKWTISKRRRTEGGFPGDAVIRKQLAEGTHRLRVGILPGGRAPAREGTEIQVMGKTVGRITSGGFGPSADRPVAMGYVDCAAAALDTPVDLIVRGKILPAGIVAMPFVPHRYFK